MADSIIVAVGVIVPGRCEGYTMKRAVVLSKHPNDDIYKKLIETMIGMFHTNRSNVQQTGLHGLQPGDLAFQFARALWQKIHQTTLKPINYLPVYKKSFTECQIYRTA